MCRADLNALQGMNDKSAAEHSMADAPGRQRFDTVRRPANDCGSAWTGDCLWYWAGDDAPLYAGGAGRSLRIRRGRSPCFCAGGSIGVFDVDIGRSRRYLLLTGRCLPAAKRHCGWVCGMRCQCSGWKARALELVGVLKANSPEALAATKRLLAAQNKEAGTAIAQAQGNAEARETQRIREGVAAFRRTDKAGLKNSSLMMNMTTFSSDI